LSLSPFAVAATTESGDDVIDARQLLPWSNGATADSLSLQQQLEV
jgi:hypothetical protein